MTRDISWKPLMALGLGNGSVNPNAQDSIKGMAANRLDKPSVIGTLFQLFLIVKIMSLCRVAVPPKTACKAVTHASAGRSNALLPGRIVFDDWTVCLSMDRKRIVLLSELFSSNTTWTCYINPFRVLRQPH